MQIQGKDLYDLTQPDGGKFSVSNLNDAYSFCKSIALKHYENFPVASVFIPKEFRDYIFSIYAFARISDDIADEIIGESQKRIDALNHLDTLLDEKSYSNSHSGNPILLAVHNTMKERNIPALPFKKLLIAFKRDVQFKQAANFSDLEDYCSYSANPVGELILRIFDFYNDRTAILSDRICTGLQLVNFWQDISIDLKKERVFIPSEILEKYNISIGNLYDEKKSLNFDLLLNEIYDYTEQFFRDGSELVNYLYDFRMRTEISATIIGGMKILNKLRKLKGDVLEKRPNLTKNEYFFILVNAIMPFRKQWKH